MPTQITTFEDLIKHVIKLIFAVILLVPLVIFPLYYFFYALFGINLLDIFAVALTKPDQMIALQTQLMTTEPTKTLFELTTFPGFTFAALFSTIIMIWVERKFIAKVQLRVGPQYAGRFEGILQNFADLFKLLFKEIIVPSEADKTIFFAVPFALMFVAGALLSLVPLSPTTYIADPPVGAIFVFAIIGLTPLMVMLAGWASNSKYSFLGALRALHQMVAYEIPLILSVVGVVLLAGSLDLMHIVGAQSSVWFIVLQPIGAVVFFVCMLAELERIPFDLPEADSELVAGWMTEYSGMAFGIFQLATYIKFYALSGIFVTFFLGGWYGPSPVPPEAWFVIKTFIVMLAMMVPRAVMPRVTISTLLRGGWTRLMLLTFLNLFMALLIVSFGIFHIVGV